MIGTARGNITPIRAPREFVRVLRLRPLVIVNPRGEGIVGRTDPPVNYLVS
jgi:hypothetical protein